MEHVVRTVAVADPEISVRRDRDIGRPVVQSSWSAGTGGTGSLLVNRRLLRIAHRPDFFALQRSLGDDPVLFIAEIEVFDLALFAEVHAVRTILEHRAPGPYKLALIVENHDAIGALAVFVNRVMDVNVPLSILADAVGVAVFDIGRQLAPIMNAFVLVVAFSQDRVS